MTNTIDDLFTQYEAGRLTRRQVVQALLLLATSPLAAQAPTALTSTHIDHASILVADLAKSRAFYEELFGAKARPPANDLVQLALGPSSHLTLALNRERAGTIDHVAIAVDSTSIDQAIAVARQTKPDANFHVEADGVTYFNDPDGTRLQLVAKRP